MCTARASRPAVDRAADGARIASYAADLLALANPAETHPPAIAAYAGVDEEPPTQPLLDALAGLGARILLPVISAEDDAVLDWAAYDEWDALATGPWGIKEPAGPRLGPATLHTADLVVVPALAVDRAGHRLGRGRGYYDRALGEVPRARRIAVVYATELLDRIPSEPHDEPVAWALTPDGLAKLG